MALWAAGAPRPARLLLFVPTAGAAIGFLQARQRFCVGFARRGVANFGPLGGERAVADDAARAADRRRARAMVAQACAIGAAAAAVVVVL